MKRGRGKVEFEDLVPGHGSVATRDHEACVNGVIALHRGDRVWKLERYWIDLKRRTAVAGLRYGIEGMRIGGRRRVVVPPHPAYGEAGGGELVPPRAMLICEIELLELRPARATKPKRALARDRKAGNQIESMTDRREA